MSMNGMFPAEKEKPATLDGMIACVKREVALREQCYPKWVKAGRMKQHSADNEIKNMKAVLHTLILLRDECAKAPTVEETMAGLKIFREAARKVGGDA